MSADIYIHPRVNERITEICRLWMQRGYMLTNTRRGHLQARPIPTLTNVVTIKRSFRCPLP